MLFQILVEYQNIIQVYCDEFSQIVREDLVHQPLECAWCIAQTKRHNEELKMAKVCMKSYFLYGRLFHRNLVVTRCEVQLRENSGLAQPLQ